LAGIELNLFMVAHMVLCFGFLLKMVLMFLKQGCFSYCKAMLTQHQELFCLSHSPTSKLTGGVQEAGRDTPGTADLNWAELCTIPCSTMLNNKSRGRKRKGVCRKLWYLSSQVTIIYDGALLSWRWL